MQETVVMYATISACSIGGATLVMGGIFWLNASIKQRAFKQIHEEWEKSQEVKKK